MENKREKPLILIIDDTPQNIQVLGNILRKENYQIGIAKSGLKGIETAKQKSPDLILLDVMMPEIDGHETCRRLKNDDLTKDIPIIFLTAKSEPENIIKGFELGAVDYVTKPFNTAEILVRIKTQINLVQKSKDIIEQKNQLQRLLENMSEGFVLIDKEGLIIDKSSSQAAKNIFECNTFKNKRFKDILKIEGKEATENFDKLWGHLFSGLLPTKDILKLMPKEFNNSLGEYFKLDFFPIFKGSQKNVLDQIICTTTNKTEQKKLEENQKKDIQEVDFIKIAIERPLELIDLMNDSLDTTEDFFLIKDLKSEKESSFRKFHTLKARYGQFRQTDIVNKIGKIETLIEQEDIKQLTVFIEGFKLELNDFYKKHRTLVECCNKLLLDDGIVINIEELNQKMEKINSIEELKAIIKQDYILQDLKLHFKKYEYLVDHLSEQFGKSIEIKLSGDEIRVNKAKYEPFINSCIHIFRNIVDHGIETRDERIEKNKDPKGTIKLSFENEEKSFQIRLEDDGKGINLDKIKEKAIEKGIKTKEELKSMSESEITNIIFLSQFSTKDEVSNISGRGVGMDAVFHEVKLLEGEIEVETEVDKGTMFKISLPRYD